MNGAGSDGAQRSSNIGVGGLSSTMTLRTCAYGAASGNHDQHEDMPTISSLMITSVASVTYKRGTMWKRGKNSMKDDRKRIFIFNIVHYVGHIKIHNNH